MIFTKDTTQQTYDKIIDLSKNVLSVDEMSSNVNEQYRLANELLEQANDVYEQQMRVLDSLIVPVEINNAMKLGDDGKTRMNEKVMKIENGKDLNDWINDVDKLYATRLEEMEANVKQYEETKINSNDAASAFSRLLADDNFNKIRELEKQLEYRKFYFPGGEAQLKVVKNGDMAPLGNSWDPRYIPEYINIAKQNGFHYWFIKPKVNENYYEPCSVEQVWSECSNKIDWMNRKYIENGNNRFQEIVAMFVGMKYAGKFGVLASYIKSVGENEIKINQLMLEDVYDNLGKNQTGPMMKKLVSLVGQDDFVTKDVGKYIANDDMAFDAAGILDELMKRNEEYNKFKENLWNILKENPVLNLCTNNAIMTGNNITVTQMMECSQTINNGSGNEENKDKNKENDSKKNDEKDISVDVVNNDVMNNNDVANNDEIIISEESNFQSTLIVISLILIISFVLIYTAYRMVKKAKKTVEIIDDVDDVDDMNDTIKGGDIGNVYMLV